MEPALGYRAKVSILLQARFILLFLCWFMVTSEPALL